MIHIPAVLTAEQVSEYRKVLQEADWADGRVTAGTQAAQVKRNWQVPEDSEIAQRLRLAVLQALSQSPLFFTTALPRRIYPPLFNCYEGDHNAFGNHVDNAIRTHPATAQHLRTDLSFTLFLSDPEEYEGGELVIEDGLGGHRVKYPAGDLILYPSYSVHRVEPVTKGRRFACFSWLESMVREPQQRELLYELDMTILTLRQEQGDSDISVRLTSCYHNLMRMWAVV
jgi:PKHD-type hydroxylase